MSPFCLLLTVAVAVTLTGRANSQGESILDFPAVRAELSQEPLVDRRVVAALFDGDVRTSSAFYKSPKRTSTCFCCRTYKCHRQPCPCSRYSF
ncbi:hypothetical protein AAVH_06113 [Aphelenchoides avenae]|nr:hypothetical protein AAVH_06113 [Aphelenchus avenae]